MNNRVILIASAVGGLVALIGFIAWAGTPEYVPLFSGLSAQDSNAITDKLKESGVPYRLQAGGTAIEVPAQQHDELLIKLVGQGLPAQSSAVPGYDRMDKSGSLTTSSAVESVSLQRIKEEEIAKSIMTMKQIAGATVHYAAGDDTPFVSQQRDSSASVMVSLKPGENLSDENVQSIVRLTQMSFSGLMEKSITVVNSHGDLLWDGTHSGMMESNSQIKLKRAIEQDKRTQLQALIDNTLGQHKAVIIVNAEPNFDSEKVQTKTVEPGVKTSTTSDEEVYKGAEAAKVAAPGANANGAVGNPSIAGAVGTPNYLGGGGNDNTGQYTNKKQTVTMEPSVTQTEKTVAPGGLKRLTVSALVDSKTVGAELIPSIKTTLETAIGGVDPADTTHSRLVTVAQVPFEVRKPETDARATDMSRTISLLVPLGLMLFCFILLARALKRPTRFVPGGQLALAGGGAIGAIGGDAGSPLALAAADGSLSGQTVGSVLNGSDDPVGISTGVSAPKTYDVIEEAFDANLESILHLTRSKPETVALLVKSWLSEDNNG